ncbi:MAG: dihydroorotase, partial [Rhodospirillaceae bacterium]|nr:dihydroorotase [Rhodospirillaceae bacterium]
MTGVWTAAQPDDDQGQKAYINVRLLDPASGLDIVCDAKGGLLTAGEEIVEFGANIFKDGTP